MDLQKDIEKIPQRLSPRYEKWDQEHAAAVSCSYQYVSMQKLVPVSTAAVVHELTSI